MTTELLKEGSALSIYVLTSRRAGTEYCPVLEILEETSEASRKSLLSIIGQHADRGPILNIQKSRPLGNGIFEFKSRQGDRILFFYPEGQRGVTILTHGFRKGAQVRTEIERAISYREEYLRGLR